uniref:Uncharacterized protein n=1 Tax=Romanomermis culicivorax TaxID=13658 RepID=A0A915K5P7_ROMCU
MLIKPAVFGFAEETTFERLLVQRLSFEGVCPPMRRHIKILKAMTRNLMRSVEFSKTVASSEPFSNKSNAFNRLGSPTLIFN